MTKTSVQHKTHVKKIKLQKMARIKESQKPKNRNRHIQSQMIARKSKTKRSRPKKSLIRIDGTRKI